MERFYFTYGVWDHPFKGGWTEVVADNRHMAEAAFRAYHPDIIPGLLHCCDVYPEAKFRKTEMFGPKGNLGARCHETITLQRETVDKRGHR